MISQIQPEERGRFEKFIARFRNRWNVEHSGPLDSNSFETCLPPQGDALRRPVLLEIIAIDLVTRLARRQQQSLLSYVELFTELGPSSQLPIELLEIEFLHRRHSVSPVALDEYISLFPSQAAALRKRLANQDTNARQPAGGTLVANLSGVAADIQPVLPISNATQENRIGEEQSRVADSPIIQTLVGNPEQHVPQPQSPSGSEAGNSGVANSATRIVSLESGYRMIRRIGQGSFGEVWLSEAPGGVEVALKIVRIPAGQRIRDKEIRSLDLMKRMRHPFLMQVQAFWILEDQIVIAMELGDKSLRDLARENDSTVPQAELIRYMLEAAEGIDFLHREHVVHRDIKPENLLLLKNHVKVADFGLARFMDESGWSVGATQVAGSPLYMAPEGWTGKPVPASDQYSLAMTYCMLRMGRAPFDSSSVAAVMHQHLHGQPKFEGLPLTEQEVLRKALAKHPDERYKSCSEMVHALAKTVVVDIDPNQALASSGKKVWLTTLVGGIGTIFLAGLFLWPDRAPVTIPIKAELRMRDELVIACGESKSLEISLINTKDSLTKVEPVSLPPGIAMNFNAKETELTFIAGLNAPLSESVLPLKISSTREQFNKELRVKVIESDRLRVPPGLQVSPQDSQRVEWDGRIYYDRTEYALPSGQRIEFVLIPRKISTYPAAFYITKQEVSNRWFAEFATEKPAKVRDDAPWQQGALTETFLGVDGEQLDFPVVNVTAEEANAFAEWIGGKLPSSLQWEAAAGRLEVNNASGSEGPFRPSGTQIGIGRLTQGPGKSGSWHDDISIFGIVDMAGNVRELTRSMASSLYEVPMKNILETDRVILLGNGYRDSEPWNFQLNEVNGPAAIGYGESKPDVGFRVVIEF